MTDGLARRYKTNNLGSSPCGTISHHLIVSFTDIICEDNFILDDACRDIDSSVFWERSTITVQDNDLISHYDTHVQCSHGNSIVVALGRDSSSIQVQFYLNYMYNQRTPMFDNNVIWLNSISPGRCARCRARAGANFLFAQRRTPPWC